MPRQRKRSWRDVVPIHPCAEVFPEISTEEKAALRKSIKETMLEQGVTLWVDGKITYLLDGRSRLDALEALGIEVLEGDSISRQYVASKTNALSSFGPAQLVTSLNIRRRHLTPKQRATLAVKVFEAEKAMAKGTIGKAFPMVGDGPGSAPKKSGVSGSVKGDVSAVAQAAGVSKPTARKAIREASGEAPASKPKPRKDWLAGLGVLAKRVANIPRETISETERGQLTELWRALGAVLGLVS